MAVSAVSKSVSKWAVPALLWCVLALSAAVACVYANDPSADGKVLSSHGEPRPDEAQPKPRVVSINLCTDQMLMLLAEPEQIEALSTLSRDEAGSYFHVEALDFPQVDPTAENLLAVNPDFVITGPYTSRYTLNLLAELGLRVETLPIANSVEDMLVNLEQLGDWLNQSDKAAKLISQARTRLAAIAAKAERFNAELKPRVAVYDPNGYTVGENTLRGQAIKLSGWMNVASLEGIEAYGVLGLEQLIKLKPQALIESPYSANTYSRGQMLAKHPAIQASGLDPLIINVPSNQTICAGPWTIGVIEQLAKARATFK